MSWRSAAPLLSIVCLTACGSDEAVSDETALPTQPIEIVVDDNDVPHVYGATDRDAFYGAGYMMATHRLLQVEMARRRAFGRAAEVFGTPRLEDDELARTFDWKKWGELAAVRTQQENPEEWSIMKAWVAGLNRRIEEVTSGAAPMPYGFAELDLTPAPWRNEDVLVMAKMVGFGNDLSLEFEIFVTLAEKILPTLIPKIPLPLPAHAVWTVPPEDMPALTSKLVQTGTVGSATPLNGGLKASRLWRSLLSLRVGGSNNFAIDGAFTQNGRPMLAGDPHLSFDFPGLFYALHINSKDAGGSYDAAGFSFPFLPGVSIGQTATVAWSPTTAFADVMDVWEVPSDGESVTVGGKTVAIVVRTESIPIKGTDPVEYEMRDVPGYGVLLPDDIAPLPVAKAGNVLLLRWTGFDITGPSRLTGLNRATNIDEFDAAVDQQSGLNFNMVAADANGITYRVGVDVPLRDPASHTPWRVMDGSDPSALWNGENLPRTRLPRGRASERGWIATANNDPFGFTENGRVDDDPWYYGTFFDPGWRAKRLHDELTRLASKGDVSLSEVQALQLDVHDMLADDLIPLLEEAWQHAQTDATLADYKNDTRLVTLMSELSGWDRRLTRDTAAAVVFTAFAHFATENTLVDDMSLLYQPVLELQKIYAMKFALQALRADYPGASDFAQGGRDAILLGALQRTATEFLEPRFGGVDPTLYSYADLHVTSFQDALGAGFDWGMAPTDGGECTVNVSPHAWLAGDTLAEKWSSGQGPILRLAVSFEADSRPKIHFNFPLGNVADPERVQDSGFTADWTDGNYRTMWFSRAEVDANEKERLELR
jgi:penicillin amidase